MINGDMPLEKRVNDEFDDALDAAVRLFQARHGLIINGQVDEPTFYALAVPADYRLNQLRLNAQRIDQWASALSDRYVVVNIPAATDRGGRGRQVVQRHTAVVGKVDRADADPQLQGPSRSSSIPTGRCPRASSRRI